MDEYIATQPEQDLAAPPPERAATVSDRPVRNRRVVLPIVLFLLTGLSTLYVTGIRAVDVTTWPPIIEMDWPSGLTYMVAVMSILVAHEFGHFLQAVRYRIPASLPYFIPAPILPLGTMGAVIGMEGSRADRKQLFDIGISGPIAGLVIAIPVAWYGIKTAVPYYGPEPPFTLMDPLLLQWMTRYLHPDMPADQVFQWNPCYMAGWFGMLITGLNMMPISQLDGGHTAYTLFGRGAHWLARGVVLSAVGFMVWNQQPQWVLMLLMVMFIGLDHPPTSDDSVDIGWPRKILGLVALTIPIFCFAPIPISVALE